jgi:Abortive infection alpha
VVIDPQTIGKMADASGEIAKTTKTALELTGRFGHVFEEPFKAAATMLGNEIKFLTARRSLTLSSKWNSLMQARGFLAPTRPLPLNFAIPLLTAAILEEDDDLQEAWARLLVNAGDAATEMELRTAYVEILKGMSAFDVKNLAKLAEASLNPSPSELLAYSAGQRIVSMKVVLPEFSPKYAGDNPLPTGLSISLANLVRLGCLGSGAPITFVTVTALGIALYRACS